MRVIVKKVGEELKIENWGLDESDELNLKRFNKKVTEIIETEKKFEISLDYNVQIIAAENTFDDVNFVIARESSYPFHPRPLGGNAIFAKYKRGENGEKVPTDLTDVDIEAICQAFEMMGASPNGGLGEVYKVFLVPHFHKIESIRNSKSSRDSDSLLEFLNFLADTLKELNEEADANSKK